ncbi:hypothetical protein JCM5353_009028 [Sporobolomyces roseus]
MAIPTLPEDVLEIIFDFIHDKTDAPNPESQRTFASLALVSKTFLPLARTRLYYRPLRDAGSLSIELHSVTSVLNTYNPQNLAQCLELTGNSCGQLVHSLQGLDGWMKLQGTLTTPIAARLLTVCPMIGYLDWVVSNAPDADQGLDALEKCYHIKTLGMAIRALDGVPAVEALFYKTLEAIPLENVRCLKLDINCLGGLSQRPPQISLDLESFSITGLFVDYTGIQQFFPMNASSLRSFNIVIESPIRKNHSDSMLKNLCIGIQYLHISGQSFLASIRMKEYRTDYNRSAVSPEHFLHFPDLTHLTLASCKGPSLALLKTLASHSPLLEEMNFIRSCWTSDTAVVAESASDEKFSDAVIPQEEFATTLGKFKHLRRLDLGILPTELYAQNYDTIYRSLEKQGVRVTRDVCTGSPDFSDEEFF